MTTNATELPVFPWHRGCPMAPPDQYAEVRESDAPVRKVPLATGRTAWVVTRYDLIKQVLADPRSSSARATRDSRTT
ncbi:hypothetical protein [Actinospica acidiphila]|uniref:hypothetical protein n=1 Tax=Actinospica acidiphila TaxID=304899 RepID=UPI00193F3DB9|nr:hypothetical protein [Actinospica acidiphila]MBM4832986.1 hypothetical protein [Actinospica acidiphila]